MAYLLWSYKQNSNDTCFFSVITDKGKHIFCHQWLKCWITDERSIVQGLVYWVIVLEGDDNFNDKNFFKVFHRSLGEDERGFWGSNPCISCSCSRCEFLVVVTVLGHILPLSPIIHHGYHSWTKAVTQMWCHWTSKTMS